MPIGTRQRPVKAVETTCGGLFSGSLNKCRISGLGLFSGTELAGPSTAENENNFRLKQYSDKRVNIFLENENPGHYGYEGYKNSK